MMVVVVFAAFCWGASESARNKNARGARFLTCEDLICVLFKFQRFSIFNRRRARARMIKHAITISTTIATFISLLLSAAIHVDFIHERSQIAQVVFFAVAGVIRPRFVRSVDSLDFLQE